MLTLQTEPNSIESTPAEMRQPLTIEGWDAAFVTAGDLRVVASDPNGFVRLTGTGMDTEEAVSIITSMQRRATGIAGWDLSPDTDLVEINSAWNDSVGQRFVTWFDEDRVVVHTIAVLGVADDRIDPVTVAASVTEVDRVDYESRTTIEAPAGVGDGCAGSLFC